MRIIALDVGDKRIGVARADTNVKIAIPYGTVVVDGAELQQIAKIANLYNCDLFVIGLPRNSRGLETAQSAKVREFAKRLSAHIGPIKIRFQDESLTSVEAENRLKSRGKPYQKADIDAEAAAIILQDLVDQFANSASAIPPDFSDATPITDLANHSTMPNIPPANSVPHDKPADRPSSKTSSTSLPKSSSKPSSKLPSKSSPRSTKSTLPVSQDSTPSPADDLPADLFADIDGDAVKKAQPFIPLTVAAISTKITALTGHATALKSRAQSARKSATAKLKSHTQSAKAKINSRTQSPKTKFTPSKSTTLNASQSSQSSIPSNTPKSPKSTPAPPKNSAISTPSKPPTPQKSSTPSKPPKSPTKTPPTPHYSTLSKKSQDIFAKIPKIPKIPPIFRKKTPLSVPGQVPETVKNSAKFYFFRSKPRIIIFTLGVTAILSIVIAIIWYNINISPVSTAAACRNYTTACTKLDFKVAPGDTASIIAKNLESNNIIRSQLAFSIYLKISGQGAALKAGIHSLDSAMSVSDIALALTKATNKNVFSFTILPGETIFDIKKKLQSHGYGTMEIEQAFSAHYDHPILRTKPADASLEGYLFGETYEFFSDETVENIIKRTLDQTNKFVNENDLENRFKSRGLTLHQGLILASIIQKETKSDHPIIAQIFEKRFKANDRLGSDVTVSYALELLDPKRETYRTNAEKLAIDSPFNTRKHPGLPPYPISSPGAESLRAVAQPADTDYYYFLTGDDGKMYYGKTDAEHNYNIRQFCQKLCAVEL